jgi:IS30 family transposase
LYHGSIGFGFLVSAAVPGEAIAKKLNTRSRKRYNYQTPEERFHAF